MLRRLFRPALAADLPAMAELFAASRAAAMPWLPVLHSQAEHRAFFASLLQDHIIELAEAGPCLAGMLIQTQDWIEHLYLAPAFQRQGIGSLLLQRAQQRSRELRLWCFQANTPARRFYERHGFVLERLSDGSGNEEKTPDALYCWRQASEHRL
ncbi:MAG: N-acetyltransferase family protein [Candidatus Sericytochromatia bacterium]